MALSEEQKQRNKAAKLLRDKAYKARCDAFNADLALALTHPYVLRRKQEAELVDDLISAERKKLLDAEEVLREQISKLEEQLKELREGIHVRLIRDLNERRNALYEQYREAEREQELSAQAKYPDLSNVCGVTGWTPPPDVQAKIDAIKSGRTAPA